MASTDRKQLLAGSRSSFYFIHIKLAINNYINSQFAFYLVQTGYWLFFIELDWIIGEKNSELIIMNRFNKDRSIGNVKQNLFG